MGRNLPILARKIEDPMLNILTRQILSCLMQVFSLRTLKTNYIICAAVLYWILYVPILEAGQGFAGCCAGCKRVVRRSGGGFGHLGTELFVALRIPHTCGLLHGENGKKENGKYFRAPLFKRKLTIPQILREIKNNVKTKDAKKIAAFSRICIRSTTLDPLNLRQGPNIQYGEERHHAP